MYKTSVGELMSSPVHTVAPRTRLPRIKQILLEHKIRPLPVIDDDQLVGIISLGDVRNAFPSDTALLSIYELSHLLGKLTAADVMRTGVITVDVDAPLVEAITLLLQDKVGCLPVLAAGNMIGILTTSDILRALIARGAVLSTSSRRSL